MAERLIVRETLEGEELEKLFREVAPGSTPEVTATTAPVPVEPVVEPEPAAKRVPRKAPSIPKLVPKQTPATPD